MYKRQNFRITTKTFGDDAFTLDPPDSNSPGGFRYSSSKTDVATVSATTGRVTIVGAGTAVITATQSAARGFEAGTVSATLIVAKARPTITPTKDITKTFGDDTFTIKDPVSDSNGAFTYSTSNEDVLKQSRTTGRWVIGGAGRATITVTQSSTDDFLSGTDSFVVTVRKGTPELKAPADVSKSFLDADFDLPRPTTESKGTFTYASSDSNIVSVADGKASIKAAGTVTITASQAATDDWLAASTTFKVVVAPKAPTISDFADVTKTFGDAGFSLTAPKSNSSGAFTFKSSDDKVVTVGESDGKVTVVGAGSATVTATQAATSGFSAGSIAAKVTVAKADPGISDLIVTDKAFGDEDFVLKPTAKSGGTFTYSTDKTDIFTVDAATGSVKIINVGTATLTARIASTTNYEAGSVSASVTVKKGTPKITWGLDNKTFGDAAFDITAPKSTSGGSFSYSVSAADSATVSISGSKLTILKAGTVTVNTKQDATALWNEAAASTTLIIDKAVPTLSAFTIPTKTYGNAPFTLTAPTSNVPQSVAGFTYEVVSSTGSTCNNSTSSVAAPGVVASVTCTTGQVTVSDVGSVQIRARQASSANYTSASITATLTVNGATPTISWTCSASGSCAGLKGTRYNGYFNDSVNWFATAPKHGDTNQITNFTRFSSSSNFSSVNYYSWEWVGWFRTTVAGAYTFGTYSDDASFVWIGDTATSGFTTLNALVRNGGVHPVQHQWGTTAPLTAQTVYPIRVQFGENAGGDEFRMYFRLPNSQVQIYDGNGYYLAQNELMKTEGDAPFTIEPPTSNSPGAFAYSSSNPAVATIHPTTGLVTPLAPGVATFTASQAATGTWATASTTTQIKVLTRPTIGTFVLPARFVTDPAFTPTPPTSNSNGAWRYESSNPSVATWNAASGQITTSVVGSTTITAIQSSSGNFGETQTSTVLTVNKANQAAVNVTSGAVAGVGLPMTLTASGGSGTGSFSFNLADAGSAGCSLTASTLTPAAVGSCAVSVTRAGDSTYNSATSAPLTISVVVAQPNDGLTASTAGTSAAQMKQTYGYTGSGNYWIKPSGYNGPAVLVWCDFDRQGGGWVLIGKGRHSTDSSGGWFGTENAIETAGLTSANAKSSGISKLSSEFVNKLMNGTATGWNNSDPNNHLIVNRIADAEDGLGGVGDSWRIKVTGDPTFKWVNQFGSTIMNWQFPGNGEMSRFSDLWMAGSQTGTSTSQALSDTVIGNLTGNDGTRLFTWTWDGHAGRHGWSAGWGENRGMAGNSGHAIQFVQVWAR